MALGVTFVSPRGNFVTRKAGGSPRAGKLQKSPSGSYFLTRFFCPRIFGFCRAWQAAGRHTRGNFEETLGVTCVAWLENHKRMQGKLLQAPRGNLCKKLPLGLLKSYPCVYKVSPPGVTCITFLCVLWGGFATSSGRGNGKIGETQMNSQTNPS